MSDFLIQDGQTVVLIGDSITDTGRRDQHAPYGWGYVKLTIDLITARYPERNITYFNEGIGGNTVADLHGRWEQDCLSHQPDWVTCMIGINDLHRVLRGDDTAVPVDRYEELYRDILSQAKAAGAKLVLLDPFYICTREQAGDWENQVLDLLDEYIAVVGKLVDEFGALHVRTHELFQRQLQYRPAEVFRPEPVHPNPTGHMVIAHGLLSVLGW